MPLARRDPQQWRGGLLPAQIGGLLDWAADDLRNAPSMAASMIPFYDASRSLKNKDWGQFAVDMGYEALGPMGDYAKYVGVAAPGLLGTVQNLGKASGGKGAVAKTYNKVDDFLKSLEGKDFLSSPDFITKVSGSAHSGSKYIDIKTPDELYAITVRASDHPISDHAITLHGEPDIDLYESGKSLDDSLIKEIKEMFREFYERDGYLEDMPESLK